MATMPVTTALPVTPNVPAGRQPMDTAVASTIKRIRQRKGLSTRELAAIAEVSHKTVTDLERGVNISVRTLFKVLDALDYRLFVTPRKTQEGMR